MSRVHVTCATAIRVAEGFDAAHPGGNDCKRARSWRHAGWQVRGPFGTGLDYVFRRGRSEFITAKPTEC